MKKQGNLFLFLPAKIMLASMLAAAYNNTLTKGTLSE